MRVNPRFGSGKRGYGEDLAGGGDMCRERQVGGGWIGGTAPVARLAWPTVRQRVVIRWMIHKEDGEKGKTR